jgi:endonuclease-8
MPEGDTIFRAAATLSARLVGREILRWSSTVPSLLRSHMLGRKIVRVDAVGKNLFIVFDDGRALHTHMRMHGSWHIYPQTVSPRNFPGTAKVIIEVDGCVAVCFSAPVVRMLSGPEVQREVDSLGPDVLAPSFEVGEAVRRVIAAGERPIGDTIMDQSIVAGIGNVYKSEVLFITKIDPFEESGAIGIEAARKLMNEARRLMLRNVGPGSRGRVTRLGPGGPVWVYKRSGAPCLKCGERIRMRRQGVGRRSTYYCPVCQNVKTNEESEKEDGEK